MAGEFSRREVGLVNWREHPFSTWSYQNVEEIVPVAIVSALPPEDDDGPGADPLADIRIDGPDGRSLTAAEHMERTHGDAFVAMRDGRIVAEWYAAHCGRHRPHIIFSVSKSVTGILAGIAAADGLLDPDSPVREHVAVRPGSAFHGARVRDLLDMTVSIRFVEDYLDRTSDFDRYRRAMLWNPERGPGGSETLREVLATLMPEGHAHGQRFRYASPATDMLGLVIEAATGRRYHEWLAERLWKPLGARGSAHVTVDREGTARAAGGICVTARDLARFGQLVLENGSAGGRRILPAAWIDDLRHGGSREAWTSGDFAGLFPAGRYRSCWYATGDDHGCLAAIGIHEQWIWIDPARRTVLVKLSSRPEPSHEPSTLREAAALGRIARAI